MSAKVVYNLSKLLENCFAVKAACLKKSYSVHKLRSDSLRSSKVNSLRT